jgi:hypothetical protein
MNLSKRIFKILNEIRDFSKNERMDNFVEIEGLNPLDIIGNYFENLMDEFEYLSLDAYNQTSFDKFLNELSKHDDVESLIFLKEEEIIRRILIPQIDSNEIHVDSHQAVLDLYENSIRLNLAFNELLTSGVHSDSLEEQLLSKIVGLISDGYDFLDAINEVEGQTGISSHILKEIYDNN